jgi:HEPN domain-containing protein
LPTPRHSVEVRRFQRASAHRLEEATFLLVKGGYTTASVYMAGYAVECALKALLLSTVPPRKQREIVDAFRGAKAHDFEWLRSELARRGTHFPREVVVSLVRVSSWATRLRYDPRATPQDAADTFRVAAGEIVSWVNGRL